MRTVGHCLGYGIIQYVYVGRGTRNRGPQGKRDQAELGSEGGREGIKAGSDGVS
jgi:hypothetical protein